MDFDIGDIERGYSVVHYSSVGSKIVVVGAKRVREDDYEQLPEGSRRKGTHLIAVWDVDENGKRTAPKKVSEEMTWPWDLMRYLQKTYSRSFDDNHSLIVDRVRALCP